MIDLLRSLPRISLFIIIISYLLSTCNSFINRLRYSPTILKRYQSQDSQLSVERTSINSVKTPLIQLQIRFDCQHVDSDEISDLLHELGSVSVSVEVESEDHRYLNNESNWLDLQKTKFWQTALTAASSASRFGRRPVLASTCYSSGSLPPPLHSGSNISSNCMEVLAQFAEAAAMAVGWMLAAALCHSSRCNSARIASLLALQSSLPLTLSQRLPFLGSVALALPTLLLASTTRWRRCQS